MFSLGTTITWRASIGIVSLVIATATTGMVPPSHASELPARTSSTENTFTVGESSGVERVVRVDGRNVRFHEYKTPAGLTVRTTLTTPGVALSVSEKVNEGGQSGTLETAITYPKDYDPTTDGNLALAASDLANPSAEQQLAALFAPEEAQIAASNPPGNAGATPALPKPEVVSAKAKGDRVLEFADKCAVTFYGDEPRQDVYSSICIHHKWHVYADGSKTVAVDARVDGKYAGSWFRSMYQLSGILTYPALYGAEDFQPEGTHAEDCTKQSFTVSADGPKGLFGVSYTGETNVCPEKNQMLIGNFAPRGPRYLEDRWEGWTKDARNFHMFATSRHPKGQFPLTGAKTVMKWDGEY